jgi:hypothetical protein
MSEVGGWSKLENIIFGAVYGELFLSLINM